MFASAPQRGLTRSELLVVIACFAGLVGISTPLALRLQEAARRNQCEHNLIQIGSALQGYHRDHSVLPPIAVRLGRTTEVWLKNGTSYGQNYTMPVVHANWAILLLPHLGQQDLFAAFDPHTSITGQSNFKLRNTEFAGMKCPSDRHNHPGNLYRLETLDGKFSTFARGNYAINGGPGGYQKWPGVPWEPVPDGLFREYEGEMEQAWASGVAGFNKSFSVQDFENGLSNLVVIEEVRAGLVEADARGVWALGEVGASATWWHGLFGDCIGPNSRAPRGDDTIGCHQAHQAFDEAELVRQGMPCCSYIPNSSQATSRSMHPSGINALMLDGSTRFVSDSVDPNVWHRIHSRESRDIDESVKIEPSPDSVKPGETSAPLAAPLAKDSPTWTNSIGMKFVAIQPGEFIMGLPDDGENHPTPVTGVPADVPPHQVRLTKPFHLGVCEVTQLEYQTIMATNPSWHSSTGEGRVEVIGKDANRFPVEQVSWTDAVAFCRRLSNLPAESGRTYRLPTEAEWEYCCRAGSTKPFQVPGEPMTDAEGFNMAPDSTEGRSITEVASYQPNPFGLYDMRGNVWEWCSDWYAWNYYERSPTRDPPGPAEGVLKVVRNADWRFTGMGCKYSRFHTEPWRTNPFIGFRVACEVSPRTR